MSADDAVCGKYTRVTATGLVNTGLTRLLGVAVASSTSGTIKIYDGIDNTGTVVLNTTGSLTGPSWIPLPYTLRNGCYVTVGGTLDCTFSWL